MSGRAVPSLFTCELFCCQSTHEIVCYQSGSTGFDLKHFLDTLGLSICVGAAIKMPRLSENRVRADRRYTVPLSVMLVVGNVVDRVCHHWHVIKITADLTG